ncbi:MAG: GTP-binding protein [Prochloraceae cyanobacterium]
MIIAVAGSLGAGKSQWIRQQIAQIDNQPLGYFSPQTDSVPIDTIFLKSEYPQLQIYQTGQEVELIKSQVDRTVTYIEIPWYLNLSEIEPLITALGCHRVGICSEDGKNSELKKWADEIVFLGAATISYPKMSLDIYRGILTGEILDFDSIATFWLELIQGAYGEVIRAKAIFDFADGQSYHGDFSSGKTELKFKALNLPPSLKDKADRFSGFEIVGKNLDKQEIAQTIRDCCISSEAIAYYQQQMKNSLANQTEVEVV